MLSSPSLDQAGNELLVRMARQGDEAALAELVRRWHGPLLASALRLLAYRHHDAEEAVQEAWLAIFRALPNLRDTTCWSSWTHQIVRNACLKRHRADQHQAQSTSSCPEPVDPGDPEPANNAGLRRLSKWIDRMPKAYREAVILRYRKKLEYRRIAKTLGISVGTAESNVYRGLLWLERRLKDSESSHE